MFVDEKAVGEQQPIQVGKLRLSTAIRIGASKRPQCRGRYFSDYGESCAIGAATEGMFGVNRMTFSTRHADKVFDLVPPSVFAEIIARNDRGQTRERIADWLESKGY